MNTLEQTTTSALYEAALGVQSWSGALSKACELLHSDKANLFAERTVGESGGLWEATGIDSFRIGEYQRYYASVEPLAPAAHRSGRNLGQVLTIDRLLDRRRFGQTEFFNDFWRPQGISEFLGFIDAGPNVDDPRYVHLTFYRSAQQPAFSSLDVRRIASLRHHLRQALKLQTHSVDKRATAGRLANWLVQTTSRPAFVVDKSLRFISWNEAAEVLSVKSAFLRRDGFRLTMTDAWGPALPQFRRLFERVSDAHVHTVSLVDNTTGSVAAADLHPTPELHSTGGAAAVFVVVRPVDWFAEDPDFVTLSACFGLTKREAEVCILLVNGRSSGQICEALQIGRETLKTHLKRILLKTGTHSQIGLVSAVVRLLTR